MHGNVAATEVGVRSFQVRGSNIKCRQPSGRFTSGEGAGSGQVQARSKHIIARPVNPEHG
jgi:hypothetical protein